MQDNQVIDVHESILESPYYEYIRQGTKIYETRIYDDKRRKMKVGDIWKFKHISDEKLPCLETSIKEIKLYNSFKDAIEDTGISQLLPHISSVEEGINIYENFDNGNYKENAKKYGVVRFKIKLNV